jgi:hypothetical protein
MGVGWWARRVTAVTICLLAGFAIAGWRMAEAGVQAMAKSDAAFDRGDLRDAVTFAHRAYALRAPFLPHVAQARSRLLAVAEGAEASSRIRIAVLSWTALRSVELESRTVWGGDSELLVRANQHLANLMPQLVRTRDNPGSGPAGGQAIDSFIRDSLQRPVAPNPKKRLAIVVSMLFLGAGVVLLARRRDEPTKPELRFLRWLGGGLVLVGLGGWFLIMGVG